MANSDHLATVRAALGRYARGHTLDEAPTTGAIAALCEEVERLRKERAALLTVAIANCAQAARIASIESALRAILDDLGRDYAGRAVREARRLLGEG